MKQKKKRKKRRRESFPFIDEFSARRKISLCDRRDRANASIKPYCPAAMKKNYNNKKKTKKKRKYFSILSIYLSV